MIFYTWKQFCGKEIMQGQADYVYSMIIKRFIISIYYNLP